MRMTSTLSLTSDTKYGPKGSKDIQPPLKWRSGWKTAIWKYWRRGLGSRLLKSFELLNAIMQNLTPRFFECTARWDDACTLQKMYYRRQRNCFGRMSLKRWRPGCRESMFPTSYREEKGFQNSRTPVPSWGGLPWGWFEAASGTTRKMILKWLYWTLVA